MLKASQQKFEGRNVWKIWEVTVGTRKFEIDGQNHESTSREWEVFELVQQENWDGTTTTERVWWDTLPTKRVALLRIQEFIERG